MAALSQLKFYLKSIIFGSLIAGSAFYSLVSLFFLKLVGKVEYVQWNMARAFYYSFSTLLGIKVSIKNEELLKRTPAVVISNHQSALDILVLGKVFQPGYTVTAKKALKYVPILGWVMWGSNTFFLDRSKGDKARATLAKALDELKQEDRALFIFPEGTRSATKSLDMLEFKKGAFHLAKQAKIPIIPVAVSNYSTLFHSKDKVFNRGEILVEVLPPVSTEGIETNEQVTELANRVREDMLKSIKSMGFAPTIGDIQKKSASKKVIESVVRESSPEDDAVIEASEDTPLVSAST